MSVLFRICRDYDILMLYSHSRCFLTPLVIHGERLLDLCGIKNCINDDVTKLSVPLNIYHFPSIDDLVLTDQSVVATHSCSAVMLALDTFERSLTRSYTISRALNMNDKAS